MYVSGERENDRNGGSTTHRCIQKQRDYKENQKERDTYTKQPHNTHTQTHTHTAAAKHLDRFKRTSPHGKVICYLSKCDQTKHIDGKTVHSIKAWCAVPERERVLVCESLSSFDTSAEQIQEMLKHIALEAHKMSLVRLAAEAEELRASAGAAKACCVVA